MHMRKLKKSLSLWPILFIILGTVIAILYGRGYRPDFKNKDLKPTGLISVTSDPVGAQVYIDGQLKSASNNSFSIDPNWYTAKIIKEGFLPWEKKIRVQGEVVTHLDPFLFPQNPSLSPITNSGVDRPLMSPDGTKIAYVVPIPQNDDLSVKKAGLWVYDLVERPLGLNRDPRQLGISNAIYDFSATSLIWSPDSNQILVTDGKTFRLYQTGKTEDYQDVTFSYTTILDEWCKMKQTKEKEQLSAFKTDIINMATSSAKIISFSPDETRILYEATASASIPQVIIPPMIGTNSTPEDRNIQPGKIYVYDSREDKNYFLLDKKELQLPLASGINLKSQKQIGNCLPADEAGKSEIGNSGTAVPVHWFPTSRHLVLTLSGKIDILEYDRTNWVTVYSGPFVDNFIAPWPGGSRIIILTNLNPGVSKLPNLYTVNLR